MEREWYDHWRERPDRIGRTRDWRDCRHCANLNVYRGMGVRVCCFQAQPSDCGRYVYTFHPWLRADGNLWAFNAEPEQYDDLGLPLAGSGEAIAAGSEGEAEAPGALHD